MSESPEDKMIRRTVYRDRSDEIERRGQDVVSTAMIPPPVSEPPPPPPPSAED